jgi:hypothetical protein
MLRFLYIDNIIIRVNGIETKDTTNQLETYSQNMYTATKNIGLNLVVCKREVIYFSGYKELTAKARIANYQSRKPLGISFTSNTEVNILEILIDHNLAFG